MVDLSVDRWFVWTIAIAIAVGITLWGYIQKNIIEMETEVSATVIRVI